MTDPRIAEGIKLLPELQREKANRIGKHFEHARDDIIIAALTAAGEMAGERSGERSGWKLVPVEPTEAMLTKACAEWAKAYPPYAEWKQPTAGELVQTIYRAMLDTVSAAPASPVMDDVEKAAIAAWNEESLRATGRSRLCLWSDIGVGEQEKWRGIAKSVLAAIGRT